MTTFTTINQEIDMSDKRQVATDALATLGTIIGEDEKRDAIHLAVEPVTAGETLKPGQKVGMIGPRVAASSMNPVGIVDPFLTEEVYKGDRFWLILFPGTVASLRHVWTHPAFDDPAPTVAPAIDASEAGDSRLWLESYAASIGVGCNELIERATRYVRHGDIWDEGSRFSGDYIDDEFWPHFEAVTGIKVKPDARDNFLSCSC